MRSVLIVISALAAVVSPTASHATEPSPFNAYAPATPGPGAGIDAAGAIGAAAYPSVLEATRLADTTPLRSTVDGPVVALRRPANLLVPGAGAGAAADAADGDRGRRKYLPVLLSALVPGAGEVSMGYYKRGIALMAVEVGAWSGYFYKHNQGLDTRTEYEAFADEHWNMQRWIDNHPLIYPVTDQTLEDLEQLGRDSSGSGVWPGYSPWVSKESDKQHYYENIGKYDWYISGWEDYDPDNKPRPEDLGPGEFLSNLREEYRDMRHESNQQLDAANRFIYLSIGARVFSLVQTTLLTRRSPSDDRAEADLDNHWMLRARSRGHDASEVALEYWFK